MKSLLNRKAQLGTLQGIIISILIIGLFLGIGFFILEAFSDQIGDSSTTVVNETVVLVDLPTGVFVAYNSTSSNLWCYSDFNVVIVTNVTDGATINTGNYSFQATTGKMWNASTYDVFFDTGSVNVTYTYGYGDTEACRAMNETIDAANQIPTWLTIIIILLIVGILLYIVFKVLPQSIEGGGIGGMFGSKGGGGTVAEI